MGSVLAPRPLFPFHASRSRTIALFFCFCHVCFHCLRNALTPAAGWADTPGVATAMPGFRAKFESSLRSSEQGADTVIWLATRPNDFALENGAFYFDRSVAKKHLPLAGTQVRDGRRQLRVLLSVVQVDAAAVDGMFLRLRGACESVLGEELRGFVATGRV